jgi:hypothetical protein
MHAAPNELAGLAAAIGVCVDALWLDVNLRRCV